ncbi:MAG: hypothetical protein KGJ41_03970 [Rhodospirillales bacterium]|nr:hypothetical protein [Rhodospirillales bacterium]
MAACLKPTSLRQTRSGSALEQDRYYLDVGCDDLLDDPDVQQGIAGLLSKLEQPVDQNATRRRCGVIGRANAVLFAQPHPHHSIHQGGLFEFHAADATIFNL